MYGATRPERRTAHELVRETLRRAILRGTVAGGTRLVQAEIAEQLGVSTTPVREALRDLATEGLIDLDAHRGATVHRLDVHELREIYWLRTLLEPGAMRRAAEGLEDGTLERVGQIQQRMDDETDVGLWADLNREFHGTLVAGLRLPRLRSILQGLQDGAAPYVGLLLQRVGDFTEQANGEHRELLDALAAQDGDRAAAITEHHLAGTLESLQAAHDEQLTDAEQVSADS